MHACVWYVWQSAEHGGDRAAQQQQADGRGHSVRSGCESGDGDDREYTVHIYIIRHNCM